MIVPFVACFEKENPRKYLWVFYKFLNFCIKNDFPIIAHSDYFVDPRLLKDEKYAFEIAPELYDYKIPDASQLEKYHKYMITSEENQIILNSCQDLEKANYLLLKEKNKALETVLETKIKQIEKDTNQKIKVFLTWCWYPSLEHIAKKHKIKVIMLELSTIRKGIYNQNLCYFNFHDKFDGNIVTKDYEKYMKPSFAKINLNRKELLALFLNNENMHLIKKVFDPPIYEYGYATNAENDDFAKLHCIYKDKDVIEKLQQVTLDKNALIRLHPSVNKLRKLFKFDIDNSPSSFDFITKCDKIICNISNIGFETILIGRTLLSISDKSPFSFSKIWDFDESESYILSENVLDYFIFEYFVPFDLAFSKEYILWRLTNPTEEEIYHKHVNYILNRINLCLDDICELSHKERLFKILKSKKLNQEECLEYLQMNRCTRTREYMKKIDDQFKQLIHQEQKINEYKNEISIYHQELTTILNSNSWKLTKPLRKISHLIRKND